MKADEQLKLHEKKIRDIKKPVDTDVYSIPFDNKSKFQFDPIITDHCKANREKVHQGGA